MHAGEQFRRGPFARFVAVAAGAQGFSVARGQRRVAECGEVDARAVVAGCAAQRIRRRSDFMEDALLALSVDEFVSRAEIPAHFERALFNGAVNVASLEQDAGFQR